MLIYGDFYKSLHVVHFVGYKIIISFTGLCVLYSKQITII